MQSGGDRLHPFSRETEDEMQISQLDDFEPKKSDFSWGVLDQEALNIYTVLDIIVRDLERGERPSKFALDRARTLLNKVRGE